MAGVVIDETTAKPLLTLLEAGRRSLRVNGVTSLPVEVEAVIEGIKVMAGAAYLAPAEDLPTSFVSSAVAAERIGVTVQQVRRLAARGSLRSRRVAGKLQVAAVDVHKEAELRTSENVAEHDVEGWSA